MMTKKRFLELIYQQIYWQRDKIVDANLGSEGSRLRVEWLLELARRASRKFVAR